MKFNMVYIVGKLILYPFQRCTICLGDNERSLGKVTMKNVSLERDTKISHITVVIPMDEINSHFFRP